MCTDGTHRNSASIFHQIGNTLDHDGRTTKVGFPTIKITKIRGHRFMNESRSARRFAQRLRKHRSEMKVRMRPREFGKPLLEIDIAFVTDTKIKMNLTGSIFRNCGFRNTADRRHSRPPSDAEDRSCVFIPKIRATHRRGHHHRIPNAQLI